VKVAIVQDWLVGGGAERVVEELHKIFPEAPIYTSYSTPEWRERLDNKVITGYLQHPPFKQLRRFLPVLRQRWFRKLDLSGYDLVISSSGNGEAKFVTVQKPAVHVCYCHTPTHFYWRHYDEYLKNPSIRPKWLVRLAMKVLVGPLRKKDFAAAQKVDHFIANSNHIKDDIKEFYKRDATTIFPPVEINRFGQSTEKRSGYVTAGRQVPYKKTDVIIQACNELGLPLKVIGRGPDHERLKKLAGSTVGVLDDTSDIEVAEAFANAEAFIFAAHEDFGITPVEAMASGTPVIAYKAGGALDYVKERKTGMFFEEQTVKSLSIALESFDSSDFDPKAIRKYAEQFSDESFRKNVKAYLDSLS